MDCLYGVVRPLRSIRLEANEPKEESTQGWAYSTNVLAEKFTQLPCILAARTTEDVAKAAKTMAGYANRCYRCREPDFNLEIVREGSWPPALKSRRSWR